MPNTCIRISFFKPTGFEDTHIVAGDHRGDAVKEVLSRYTDQQLKCLNYVDARLTDDPVPLSKMFQST